MATKFQTTVIHKITKEQYGVLKTAFADDLERKKAFEEVSQQSKEEKEVLRGSAEEMAEAPEEAPASRGTEGRTSTCG